MLVGTAEVEVVPLTAGFQARLLRELEPQVKATSARMSAVMSEEMTKGAQASAARMAAVQDKQAAAAERLAIRTSAIQEREAAKTAEFMQRQAMQTAAMQERLIGQANARAARTAESEMSASSVRIRRNLEGSVGSGFGAVESARAGARRSMDAASKEFARFGLIGTAGIAAGIGAAIVAGVHFATGFEQEMEKVRTQAGATQAEVDRMRNSVLALAGPTAQSPEHLAEGLYHIESAGFRGAQALAMLTAAAKGASIGNANLEDVTQAMIASMASGIKGVRDANDAMALINATVGTGDMRMEGLARAFATGILPSARSAGLSLEDVGAALATITDNATPPDEAATRLRMTFALMSAPTTKAAAALKTIGMSSTQMAEDMRRPNGLLVAVMDLKHHLEAAGLSAVEQNQVIEHAFGGGRTSGAILTLIEESDRLRSKYDAYANVAERTRKLDDAWNATRRTTAFELHSMEGAATGLLIRIGTMAMPTINRAIGGLAGLFGDLSARLDTAGNVVGRFGGWFSDNVLPVLRAVGSYLRDSLLPALERLARPLEDFAVTAGNALGSALRRIGQALSDARPQLEAFTRGVERVGQFLEATLLPVLGPMFQAAMASAAIAVSGFIHIFAGLVDLFDHHKILVGAVAVALTALLIPALAATITKLELLVAFKVGAFLQTIITGAAAARTALLGMMTGPGALIAGGALALGYLTDQIVGLTHAASDGRREVDAMMASFHPTGAGDFAALSQQLLSVQQSSMKAGSGVTGLIKTVVNLSGAVKDWSRLDAAGQALDELSVREGTLGQTTVQLALQLGVMPDKIAAIAKITGSDLSQGFGAATDAVKRYYVTSVLGTPATEALAEANRVLGNHVETATQRVEALRTVLDGLVGSSLSSEEAESRYQAAIDSATTALRDNHGALVLTTDAGRQDRAALRELVQAGKDRIENMIKQNATSAQLSAAMQGQIADFTRTATAAGLTTQQVQALLVQYGLTPGQVKTFIQQYGAQDATQQADTLGRHLHALDGTTAHVSIVQDVISHLIGPPVTGGTTGGLDQLLGGRATGGLIRGPGTGTSDSIVARVSAGEYVVNAAATAANLPLLQAINARRFATGGLVPPPYRPVTIPSPSSPADAAPAMQNVHVETNVNLAPGTDAVEAGHVAAREVVWQLMGPSIPVRLA